jgi:hypothetical protein
MIRPVMLAAAFALFCLPLAARAADALPAAPAPKAESSVKPSAEAHAFFVNVKNGDTITSPFKIRFGVTGMEVAPAGSKKPGTGHFHLLIDTKLTPEQQTLPIPKDDQHLHFGGGQKEATISLKPGKHTLQIVMGDGDHKLHNPPVMSKVITVTVSASSAMAAPAAPATKAPAEK